MRRSYRQLMCFGMASVVWMTWQNITTTLRLSKEQTQPTGALSPLQEALLFPKSDSKGYELQFPYSERVNTVEVSRPTLTTKEPPSTHLVTTKILGFADYAYRDYALRWYHRLEALGYTEQIIVAVDSKSIEFFQQQYGPPKGFNSTSTPITGVLRWEALPYPPCLGPRRDPRGYRRQLFGRRWKYVYGQLQQGFHVLLTDVDNVFSRHLPMKDLEDQTDVDAFHAYSTSYPTDVFKDMGLTVCGGMSWLRATAKVIRFVGSLLNQCKCLNKGVEDAAEEYAYLCKNCQCDDQVVLNELLWKGKHKILWDRNLTKPSSLRDWQWRPIRGISSTTRHRIQIWDRNVAFRAPMPDTCPTNNWVSMPLYVNRSEVVETWDKLCSNTIVGYEQPTVFQ